MGKDDARKKRDGWKGFAGVEWGISETASSKRWYHID
jgi:hypothetical protein